MNKDATPTSNMSPAETEAWVSMAKDRTLRDSLEVKELPKAMQRRMEKLRQLRQGERV